MLQSNDYNEAATDAPHRLRASNLDEPKSGRDERLARPKSGHAGRVSLPLPAHVGTSAHFLHLGDAPEWRSI